MAKKPPGNLRAPGRALWRAILRDLEAGWELDARELHLLERACRCADEAAILEKAVDKDGPTITGSKGQQVVHPAISEARQLRLVQLRLLSVLELADPAGGSRSATPAVARARQAANARWKRSGAG